MSSAIDTPETKTAPITMEHSLNDLALIVPGAGVELQRGACLILRRIVDQNEPEPCRKLCLTSTHIGRALETFETILSFKMSGRLEDVEPELDAWSCWLMTTREHHILGEPLMTSRARPWCQAFLLQGVGPSHEVTRRSIPLDVRHDKSDGNEPTPTQIGDVNWAQRGKHRITTDDGRIAARQPRLVDMIVHAASVTSGDIARVIAGNQSELNQRSSPM